MNSKNSHHSVRGAGASVPAIEKSSLVDDAMVLPGPKEASSELINSSDLLDMLSDVVSYPRSRLARNSDASHL